MNRYTALKIPLAAWLLHALPCSAMTCDELRSEVEAKIRGAGVSQFTVTVMDAGAASSGQVVGSCDRGSKKLIYRQTSTAPSEGGSPIRAAAPTPRPPRTEDTIPTECKDGSISMTGRCKSP